MIKTLAFDYGGVIELYNGNSRLAIANLLGKSKEEFFEEYFKHNHRTNVEGLSFKEVIGLVAKSLGATDEQLVQANNIIDEENSKKKLNTELIEWIKAHKSTYKIALVSNYLSELRQRLKDQQIIDLFDEIIISGEIGYQKPHPQVFNILCERMNIAPDELVFIDDTTKSLEGAETIGYRPILFKNNQQFIEDLNAILKS